MATKLPKEKGELIKEKFITENETLKRVVVDDVKKKLDIEIGDSKDPDFKPQFKLKKWDNEVNFSIRRDSTKDAKKKGTKDKAKVEATVEYEGEKVKYVDGNEEVHLYEKKVKGKDGFEIEILLKEKPDTNVFHFSLETKGLKFYKQPALTETEIEYGDLRPDDVVGSYAVYHDSRKHNYADMSYETGKFCHIYRPYAYDANIDNSWCELDIDVDKKELTVTVPQDFLDNAVYPVVIDPTFGYDTAGASQTTLSQANQSLYQLAEFIAVDGTLTGLSSHANPSGGARPWKALIYDDTEALVSVGSAQNTSAIEEWHDATFSSIALTQGFYYLGLVINTSYYGQSHDVIVDPDLNYIFGTPTTNNYASPLANLGAPLGGTPTSSRILSIYGTFSSTTIPPSVVTDAVTGITTTGVVANGEIVDIGSSNATIRGFEYETAVITPTLEGFETDFGPWTSSGTTGWVRRSGATASAGTGPTTAQAGTFYVYVETSSGSSFTAGDEDYLEADCGDGDLTFQYHQYGPEQGTLAVEGWNGTAWIQEWSSSGDQGNQWNGLITVPLAGYTRVRFRNYAIGGWGGDIALDAVTLPQLSYGSPSLDNESGSFAAGTYSLPETLTPGRYRVRAYATNPNGTQYGEWVEFEVPSDFIEVDIDTAEFTTFTTPTPQFLFTGNDSEAGDVTYDIALKGAGPSSLITAELFDPGGSYTGGNIIPGVQASLGQTFKGNGKLLQQVMFGLSKEGAPSGPVVAKIWEHSGTFGVNGVPVGGQVLATSQPIEASALIPWNSFAVEFFVFSSDQQIVLEHDVPYVVTVEFPDGDGSNYILALSKRNIEATHEGNFVWTADDTLNSWNSISGWDHLFGIYTYDSGFNIYAQSGERATSYHFDASGGATVDANSSWTGEANITDNNLLTAASRGAGPFNDTPTSNALHLFGTSSPEYGSSSIQQVRARIAASNTPSASDWGSYVTLSTPTGGWTYDKVRDLEAKVYFTAPFDDEANAAIYTAGLAQLLGTATNVTGIGGDNTAQLVEIEVTTTSDAGFANITTPADTDPFEHSDQIGFTPQINLKDGPYWFQVRIARDSEEPGPWVGPIEVEVDDPNRTQSDVTKTLAYSVTSTSGITKGLQYVVPGAGVCFGTQVYRKEITLAGSVDGALTDYPVFFDVHYSAGTDANNDIYLNSNCRTDFGDIRFTQNDGLSVLDYFVDYSTDSDVARVWVNIPSIPASPGAETIAIEYGDNLLVSTSSIVDTFDKAILFDTDTPIAIYNQDANELASYGDNFAQFGNGSGRANNWKGYDVGNFTLTSGSHKLAYLLTIDGLEAEIVGTGVDNQIVTLPGGGDQRVQQTFGTQNYTPAGDQHGGTGREYIESSALDLAGTYNYLTVIHDEDASVAGVDTRFDNVRLRKFTTNEPTVASVAAEEQCVPTSEVSVQKSLSFEIQTTLSVTKSLGYEIGTPTTCPKAGWSSRQPVTVNASEIDATLTDFPVGVNLGELSANFWTEVRSDGGDIRVTTSDGSTEVPIELAAWDYANETGVVYFKAPSLSSSVDTVFYVYVGNSGATGYGVAATYGRNNVWTGHEIVAHLNTDPTAPDSISDSTGNGNTGNQLGSMTSADVVDAPLGKALNFDGINDGINFGDVGIMGTSDLTFMILYRFEAGGGRALVSKSFYSGDDGRYALLIEEDGTGDDATILFDGGIANYNGVHNVEAYNDPGDWHVAHVVYDRSENSYLYIDGAEIGTANISPYVAINLDAGNNLYLGQYNNAAGTGVQTGQNLEFDGDLGHFRHQLRTRTPEWISAEATNILTPATFYTIGAFESCAVSSTTTESETKSLEYTIENTDSINRSLAYEVERTDSVTKSMSYEVETTDSVSKSLSYEIETTDSISKSLEFAILTTSSVTKQLAYQIESNTAISKALLYRVASSSSVTKSLEYTLQTASSISKTLDYSIAIASSINKALEYVVLSPSTITKSLTHSIKSLTTLTRQLGYDVVQYDYSREATAVLPSADGRLSVQYSNQDITDVATDDGNRVCVTGIGYVMHLFRRNHNANDEAITAVWNGQTDRAPLDSTVYLQIYNDNSGLWETLDSNSVAPAGSDFTLTGSVSTSLGNYYQGAQNTVAVRIYQEAI
jgi:hypothetical protein